MFLEVIIAIVIGVVAGGVINVLADDLVLRRHPRLPRYVQDAKKRAVHVPVMDADGNDISWDFVHEDDERRPPIAWLGITAFLFGKRTSSDGSVRLSWRYPLTEVMTALLMVIAVLAIDAINDTADPGETIGFLQTLFWLFYIAVLMLVTVIDVEHKLILFIVIIPSSIVAILDPILTGYPPDLTDALVGGVAGFVVFFVMYNGGFIFTYIMGALRGRPIEEVAFGYGDVMLATFSGLILGWRYLIFAMFITVFLGAFGAIVYLLGKSLSGGKYSAFTALPYGPYIVAGTLLMLLFREPIGSAMFGAVFP